MNFCFSCPSYNYILLLSFFSSFIIFLNVPKEWKIKIVVKLQKTKGFKLHGFDTWQERTISDRSTGSNIKINCSLTKNILNMDTKLISVSRQILKPITICTKLITLTPLQWIRFNRKDAIYCIQWPHSCVPVFVL